MIVVLVCNFFFWTCHMTDVDGKTYVHVLWQPLMSSMMPLALGQMCQVFFLIEQVHVMNQTLVIWELNKKNDTFFESNNKNYGLSVFLTNFILIEEGKWRGIFRSWLFIYWKVIFFFVIFMKIYDTRTLINFDNIFFDLFHERVQWRRIIHSMYRVAKSVFIFWFFFSIRSSKILVLSKKPPSFTEIKIICL